MKTTETDERPINRKIINRFNLKPSVCDCDMCRTACKTCPCQVTPDDVIDIIEKHGISRDMFKPTVNMMYFELGLVNIPMMCIAIDSEVVYNDGLPGCRCKLLTDDEMCSIHEFKPLGGRYADTHEKNPLLFMSIYNAEFAALNSWMDRNNIDKIKKAYKLVCRDDNDYRENMNLILMSQSEFGIIKDSPNFNDISKYSKRLREVVGKINKK